MSHKTVWGRVGSLLALGLTLALVPGCPGEDEDDDSDDPGGAGTVSGKVTYDFVPAVFNPSTRSGTLAFNQTVARPVRGAVVQVRQGSQILATGSTDEQGAYTLSFTAAAGGGLSVFALAKTTTPPIQIEDNTSGDAVWAISASIVTATTTKDLHATHGWTGSSFTASQRTAAPFAVLDSMYTASRKFMAARTVNFPALKVNWSPNNVPERGEKKNGFIQTSHYTSQEKEIYVLGKDGADTDEFDSHVIVHEWGHYFEDNLSRSDSPGGPHGKGDVLDPRLAFGEGYGNALSAILLPETVYVDTYWNGSAWTSFGFDLETAPSPTDDTKPGPFSEYSVMRFLYDLIDSGTNESAYDQLSIDLGTFYDVLVGPQKTTEALTTIGSFITALKAQPGVNVTAVNTLLAHYNIGPVTTDFGDGDSGLRDIYIPITIPYSDTYRLDGGLDYNKWGQNQYFVFTGTGGNLTVTARNDNFDVAVTAYRQGTIVGQADATLKGVETFTFASQSGVKYVLVLTGFNEIAGEYPVAITISP